MPYVFKKGFVNTLENIKNGKELDMNEPMYFNLSKKKGEEGYTSEHRVEFKFKRKIPILAYSFEIQRTPDEEKQVIENEREPLPEDQVPNNRAYMYIYSYNMNDGKQVQMNYMHWSKMPELDKAPSKCFRWRDGGSVITDRFDLKL